MYELGVMYQMSAAGGGHDVEGGSAREDMAAAADWFAKASRHGHPMAARELLASLDMKGLPPAASVAASATAANLSKQDGTSAATATSSPFAARYPSPLAARVLASTASTSRCVP